MNEPSKTKSVEVVTVLRCPVCKRTHSELAQQRTPGTQSFMAVCPVRGVAFQQTAVIQVSEPKDEEEDPICPACGTLKSQIPECCPLEHPQS